MLQGFGLLRHESHEFEGSFENRKFKFAIQLMVLVLPHGVKYVSKYMELFKAICELRSGLP